MKNQIKENILEINVGTVPVRYYIFTKKVVMVFINQIIHYLVNVIDLIVLKEVFKVVKNLKNVNGKKLVLNKVIEVNYKLVVVI